MKFLRMITKHFLFFISHEFYVLQKKIYLNKKNENLINIFNNIKLSELLKELDQNGYIIIKNFLIKIKLIKCISMFMKN